MRSEEKSARDAIWLHEDRVLERSLATDGDAPIDMPDEGCGIVGDTRRCPGGMVCSARLA